MIENVFQNYIEENSHNCTFGENRDIDTPFDKIESFYQIINEKNQLIEELKQYTLIIKEKSEEELNQCKNEV
jgi:hypothetical protein